MDRIRACTLAFPAGQLWEPRAVALAREFPGYSVHAVVDGDASRLEHLVPVTTEVVDRLQPLLLTVLHDRATRLLVDGVEVARTRLWDLLRLTSCRRDLLMQSDPERCWGATGSHRGAVPCRILNRTLGAPVVQREVEAGCLDATIEGHEADALVALCPAYDHARVLRAAMQAVEASTPSAS